MTDFGKFVSLFLNGAKTTSEGVANAIKGIGKSIQDSMLTSNKQASAALYQFVLRNFQEEGGLVGGWEPLAPETIAYKNEHGYTKMLQNTGFMRASFLPYADDSMALVGSPLIYAAAHDQGLGRVPERRLLPNAEEAQEIVMPIYGQAMKIVTGKRL